MSQTGAYAETRVDVALKEADGHVQRIQLQRPAVSELPLEPH